MLHLEGIWIFGLKSVVYGLVHQARTRGTVSICPRLL
jgi:hypothetical protein